MITYKATIDKNYQDVLVHLLMIIVVTVISYILSILLYSDHSVGAPIFLFTVLLILLFFRLLDREKIDAIVFDNSGKKILFNFKTIFNKKKTETLLFEKVTIEVERINSNSFLSDKLTISFIKNEIVFFELTQKKDGFNEQALQKILETAKDLAIPVTENFFIFSNK